MVIKNFSFSIETLINANNTTVWQHVTKMKNVNAELMPFARMTYPKNRSEIGNIDIPLNEILFKSIILLFGFIPVDIHFLKLDRIDVGTAFYENSTSLTHHYWKHTPILTEQNGKTLVRYEVHFSPRIRFLGTTFLAIIKRVFENRHEKLKQFL